jgi:hypothetical protein
MATKRKTSADYRKEYMETVTIQKGIKNHLVARIKVMIKKYPDARILEGMKAKEFIDDRDWELSFDITALLFILDRLERFSADQQKVKQLTIDDLDD